MKNCLASWKKYAPDYQIICWNEDNFNVNICPYTAEAYQGKKYAFVADYCRLYALKKYGGFYFDTDVALLKQLDFLRSHHAVSGFEEGNYLQTAFIGSEPDGEWISYLFEYYDGKRFYRDDGSFDVTTNVSIATDMTVNRYALSRTNREQDLGALHVYPIEYFSPKSFSTGLVTKSSRSVCIHHFDSSWTGKENRKRLQHRYRIFRIFGNKLGRKVLSFEEVTKTRGIFSAISRIFSHRLKDPNALSIVLYGHTGSNNHGCEALTRTIYAALPDIKIDLISTVPAVDLKYNIPYEIIHQWQNDLTEFSPKWFLYKICQKFLHSSSLCDFLATNFKMLRIMKRYDGVFAIGGDNYCYNQGKPYFHLDRDLRKRGIKNGIIGCSMEPDDLENRELGRHIQNFGLITARESITYQAILKTGYKNAYLIPDSAFILTATELPLPEYWLPGNTIGLNFSPLSLKYAKDPEIAKKAIRSFIQYLLEHTDAAIAFIAHVYKADGGDAELMKSLVEGMNSTRIIHIADNKLNCQQIKGYISRCRFFIGARTHATIAGYSSCVPTLAIGYSVKSRGIARDLFNTEENYVLPIESISSADDLISAFRWLQEHEPGIRNRLVKIMPEYQKRVHELARIIGNYLKA
ncbi:MAG: polysaccharide pyruvyl transferase family protein [Victivallaceae bacterium]|nr:polysaccharide pyruvyl transferase family protein [Victivallaceae bacterium]